MKRLLAITLLLPLASCLSQRTQAIRDYRKDAQFANQQIERAWVAAPAEEAARDRKAIKTSAVSPQAGADAEQLLGGMALFFDKAEAVR